MRRCAHACTESSSIIEINKADSNWDDVWDPEDCRWACMETEGCTFFLFKPNQGLCMLLMGVNGDEGAMTCECDGSDCWVSYIY